MKRIHRNTNVDLIIRKKSIVQVEMLDERSNLQGMKLHPQNAQTMTIGLLRQEDPDPVGRSVLDVIDPGHVVAPDQGDVERATHLTKGEGHGQIKEKKNISPPRTGEGEMTLLHHRHKEKTGLRTVLLINHNHRLVRGSKGLSQHNHSQQVTPHQQHK